MINRTLFLLLSIIFIALISCSKGDADENTIPQSFTQKIVVEKYTGEWCGACVGAGSFFKNNETTKNFIGVAIHAGSSSKPDRYKSNQACVTMYSHLNRQLRHQGLSSISFPNIMFNRTAVNSDQIINGTTSNTWSTAFEDLSSSAANCGLSIESELSGTTLSGTVSYVLKETILNDPAITVYLVENELDGSQQVSANASYKHQRVLRELMTEKEGHPIDGSITNQKLSFAFDSVDISEYNSANLVVIAFIHESGDDYLKRRILNGQQVSAGLTQNFD